MCSPFALTGGVARCAAAFVLVAAVAWLVVRRSRGYSSYAGLPAGALHASHAAQHTQQQGSAAGHGLPSIIPGVRERFDLTEVVEQTGGCCRYTVICWHMPGLGAFCTTQLTVVVERMSEAEEGACVQRHLRNVTWHVGARSSFRTLSLLEGHYSICMRCHAVL